MQETIEKIKKGDKKAYRLLFDRFYAVMCLFAKKFLKEYEDAEDIVQEIFIELWNQRTKFESFEQVKAFLYMSVKNRCLNFIKHQMVKEKYLNTVTIQEDIEENVLEVEVVQNIVNAVNDLPEQRRKIILLSMQGFKNDEIAEDMNISINTVKLQKKIAYSQLRERLRPSLLSLLL